MKKEPKLLTFDEFAEELLIEQQPRALIILASAKMDTQLRKVIEAFLWPKTAKAKDDEELFDFVRAAEPFGNLRQIDPETLYEARGVGRKALPTTVIGLIVHLAEHTQRHLGQAITTIKTLRDTG